VIVSFSTVRWRPSAAALKCGLLDDGWAWRRSGGRSAGRISEVLAKEMERSMMFSSSRTLPGYGWSSSRPSASPLMHLIRTSFRFGHASARNASQGAPRLHPVAQRRKVDVDHVQPVEQVFTEQVALARCLEGHGPLGLRELLLERDILGDDLGGLLLELVEGRGGAAGHAEHATRPREQRLVARHHHVVASVVRRGLGIDPHRGERQPLEPGQVAEDTDDEAQVAGSPTRTDRS